MIPHPTIGFGERPNSDGFLAAILPLIEGGQKMFPYSELERLAGIDVRAGRGRQEFYRMRKKLLRDHSLWLANVSGQGYEVKRKGVKPKALAAEPPVAARPVRHNSESAPLGLVIHVTAAEKQFLRERSEQQGVSMSHFLRSQWLTRAAAGEVVAPSVHDNARDFVEGRRHTVKAERLAPPPVPMEEDRRNKIGAAAGQTDGARAAEIQGAFYEISAILTKLAALIAVVVLGVPAGAEVVEVVVRLLASPVRQVKRAALRAAARLGLREALPMVRQLRAERDPFLAEDVGAAIDTLERAGKENS